MCTMAGSTTLRSWWWTACSALWEVRIWTAAAYAMTMRSTLSFLTKKPHMNWTPCSSMTSWTVPCLPRKNIKTLRMETLRRLVRQSVHSIPINLRYFPKQRFTDYFISCKDGAYPIRKYSPCSKAWQVIIKESNACRQEKCYSTITDGIPDKCGKPRLSCKETLFSPYVSLYYRTKIK